MYFPYFALVLPWWVLQSPPVLFPLLLVAGREMRHLDSCLPSTSHPSPAFQLHSCRGQSMVGVQSGVNASPYFRVHLGLEHLRNFSSFSLQKRKELTASSWTPSKVLEVWPGDQLTWRTPCCTPHGPCLLTARAWSLTEPFWASISPIRTCHCLTRS